MPNLAIVGYGKMGRLIEQMAPQHGFDVKLRLDIDNNAGGQGVTRGNFRGVDVAVEFSTPSTAAENVQKLAAIGVNAVVGTTGWDDHLPAVRAAVMKSGAGVVWAPNFSIGVNLFMKIVGDAATLFAKRPEYGAWGWELHHAEKKDAPSGTLLKLAEEMRRAGFSRPIDLNASRAGAAPGTHEIGFDSVADTITLRHTARGREGFALGALLAAKWVIGKTGFYEFQEILGELS